MSSLPLEVFAMCTGKSRTDPVDTTVTRTSFLSKDPADRAMVIARTKVVSKSIPSEVKLPPEVQVRK